MRMLRLTLLLLLIISTGEILAVTASASAQTPTASPAATPTTLLFVQQATSGALDQTGTGQWSLTLTGVSPYSVYFADRPARAAGTVPTADLVSTTDLFDPTDPPNAAVVLAEPTSEDADVFVVELREPVYDAAAGTLRYTVTLLGEDEREGQDLWSERADSMLPEAFGNVALFIDSDNDCLSLGLIWCLANG